MDRLVALAVNRRYLMVAMFIAVFIGGLFAFQHLNIEAYPDPTDKTGKFVCVDIKADKPLKTPVTMAAIKADKKLADMALVKYSRLSVQPVTAEEWKYVCKMGGL